MENGHVKIPIELYDKLKDLERSAEDLNSMVNAPIQDLINFIIEFDKASPIKDKLIHDVADKCGFKIIYTKKREKDMDLVLIIGTTGTKIYKLSKDV